LNTAAEPVADFKPEAVAESAAPQAKILLVDDEPKSLYALQQLLSQLEQNLMIAQSGEEALRLALKNDFAVILLDVRMPGIDGFETARLIRNRERSRLTPIIFLTAAADEMASMFRGYEVGAVDYLMKPVVPEVLKSKVAVFVELHRKSERLKESEDKLRRLAAHLISVREEERAHIAREIHDELGQVLTGLKMEVGALAKRLTDKALIEKTDSMGKLIDFDGADGAQDRHRPAAGDARRHGPDRRGRLAGEGIPEAHRHPLPAEAAARGEARHRRLDDDVPHLPGDPHQRRAAFARDARRHRARDRSRQRSASRVVGPTASASPTST
jgi:CheY-like chemotaxis protein